MSFDIAEQKINTVTPAKNSDRAAIYTNERLIYGFSVLREKSRLCGLNMYDTHTLENLRTLAAQNNDFAMSPMDLMTKSFNEKNYLDVMSVFYPRTDGLEMTIELTGQPLRDIKILNDLIEILNSAPIQELIFPAGVTAAYVNHYKSIHKAVYQDVARFLDPDDRELKQQKTLVIIAPRVNDVAPILILQLIYIRELITKFVFEHKLEAVDDEESGTSTYLTPVLSAEDKKIIGKERSFVSQGVDSIITFLEITKQPSLASKKEAVKIQENIDNADVLEDENTSLVIDIDTGKQIQYHDIAPVTPTEEVSEVEQRHLQAAATSTTPQTVDMVGDNAFLDDWADLSVRQINLGVAFCLVFDYLLFLPDVLKNKK